MECAQAVLSVPHSAQVFPRTHHVLLSSNFPSSYLVTCVYLLTSSSQVQRLFPDAALVFPKRTFLGKQDSRTVETRRAQLEEYLRGVVTLCLSQPKSPLLANPCKKTLIEVLPFLMQRSSHTPAAAEKYSGL
jgi:hypothetical protein